MTQHPLRAYAHGDLSSNYRGRSGDQVVGAILEHATLGLVEITLDVDGAIEVSKTDVDGGERTSLLTASLDVDDSTDDDTGYTPVTVGGVMIAQTRHVELPMK